MNKEYVKFFTSESIGPGHSDVFCDAVSNYLQDKYMAADKQSKLGIETAAFGRNIFVGGEVKSNAQVDVIECVKDVLCDVGYAPEGFNIENHILEQSSEINNAVVKADGEIGAGDQGLVFGYASNGIDTEYMPKGGYLAHALAKRLDEVRRNGTLRFLGPDAKTQVTAKINQDGDFIGVDTVVVSSMHDRDVSLEQVRADIKAHVVDYVLHQHNVDTTDVKYLINTAGAWSDKFFSEGDAGLTGRKIIQNSYLGYGRHGGGNFNGKDASKVDRSGAYMARYLAKNILHHAKQRFASLHIKEVEIQIGYAIGVVEPVSINVEVRGRGGEVLHALSQWYQAFIEENISCSPKGIIDRLDLLNQPMYPTSFFGHFGHKDYTWEQLNIDFSTDARLK